MQIWKLISDVEVLVLVAWLMKTVDYNYMTVPGSCPPAPVTHPPSRPPLVRTPSSTADINLGSYSPSTGGLTNQVRHSTSTPGSNPGHINC